LMQLKCYDYGFQNDWSFPFFSKDARNKVSLKLFHTFLAILFFNVYVTYLCNLNCKSNFHMLYGSCNFKLSLSRGYKEFWHKKTMGWKESMEWVISSNNNVSKKHEITNLRKEIHNTLHNHVWFPKLSFQNVFYFWRAIQIWVSKCMEV
jgi:hypothetical protein